MKKHFIAAAVCAASFVLLMAGSASAHTDIRTQEGIGAHSQHEERGTLSQIGMNGNSMPGFTGWSQDKMNAMAGAGGYEAAITPEISREEALQIALKDAGITESQAEFTKAELDFDDGVLIYDVGFYKGDIKYDYDIDAKNGTIWAAGWKILKQYRLSEENGARGQEITGAKAEAGAKAEILPASEALKPDKLQTEAASGETKPKESASAGAAQMKEITDQQALQIALKAAGVKEAEISRVRTGLDYEHGRKVYEVHFNVGWTEYEYDIDVNTGEIVKYDIDIDD